MRSETLERQEASTGVFREGERPGRSGGLFREAEGGGPGGGTESYPVSGVNDPAEIHAEQEADRVMSGGIFRETDRSSGDGIFRSAEGVGPEGGSAELSSADLSEPGSALPAGLQESMGASLGADFSGVRVHTGPGADRASEQISARAFTRGQDVYFRSGAYDTASPEGQHLIAHELAHVANGDMGLHRNPGRRGRNRQTPSAASTPGTASTSGTAPAASTPGTAPATPAPGTAPAASTPGNAPAASTPGTTPAPASSTPAPANQNAAPQTPAPDPLQTEAENLMSQPDTLQVSGVRKIENYVKKKSGELPKDAEIDPLSKRYVSNDDVVGNYAEDLTKMTAMKQKMDDLARLQEKLTDCRDAVSNDFAKTAMTAVLEAYTQKLDTCKQKVDPLLKAFGDYQKDHDDAAMSDITRKALADPGFEEFKKAALQLKAAGVSIHNADANSTFETVEKETVEKAQADNSLGRAAAETDLQAKRTAMGMGESSTWKSKLAGISNTSGEFIGETADEIGAMAGAGHTHRLYKKTGDDEAAGKEGGDIGDSVGAIAKGTGAALSGIGGALEASESGARVKEEREKNQAAKAAMVGIGAQMERALPKSEVNKDRKESRYPRVFAVCEQLKKKSSTPRPRTRIIPSLSW